MNKELKARVEEANEFITALANGNGNMTEPNYSRLQRLMNDLSTALQEADVINEAGFMQPKRCTQDCLNYHGALADADHFEEAFKLSQQKLRVAVEALEEECGDRCNAEYNPCWAREALAKIEEMEEA